MGDSDLEGAGWGPRRGRPRIQGHRPPLARTVLPQPVRPAAFLHVSARTGGSLLGPLSLHRTTAGGAARGTAEGDAWALPGPRGGLRRETPGPRRLLPVKSGPRRPLLLKSRFSLCTVETGITTLGAGEEDPAGRGRPRALRTGSASCSGAGPPRPAAVTRGSTAEGQRRGSRPRVLPSPAAAVSSTEQVALFR